MLEGYITPLLVSYLDKYVKNIKPSDLQLSFWGGDAVLRNLALRVEVLEKELHIPLEFTSGRIRELTLHIPWNAIASSPVQVTIKDLELILRLKSVRGGSNNVQPSESTDSLSSTVDPPASTAAATSVPRDKDKAAEQAPGYLQTYLSRISNNIQVHVQNLVVKVMEEECDLMLTLNVGEVEYFTADENWEKKFIYTDYLQGNYAIHKICKVSDMTVNLHTIEIGGQETASHEPFLQRCSFTFRMRSEYRGNIFVKKSSNILFDSLTFSVDEKQFCLFLHLLDWLMAMYYSSKRLKGRDDQLNDTQQSSKTDTPKSTKIDPSSSTPTTPESSKDHLATPKASTTLSDHPTNTKSGSSQGWGTWMWSFIADADDGTSGSASDLENSSGVGKGRQGSKSTAIEPSSTFAVFAKSIRVMFKITHQVQVPLFYSFRHFTTPVLHVSFTGCMAQLDKVPLTTLFLVSMGIGSVSATVTGLCPCVKRFPSSWRRASAATSTTNADSAEQILVFSMGVESGVGGASTVGVASNVDDDSCNECEEKIIDHMLKRSLFAPLTSTTTSTNIEEPPPTPDSGTIELPPLSDVGLSQLGEHYTALWFTYQYFDTGPSRSVEECTETLRVGHVTATLSPDVLHRLQHFIRAFGKSLEANPRFTEGMIVLGDPSAETLLNIELTGFQVVLTANGHYLSTLSPGSPHVVKSKKSSKKARKPKSFALPSICVVNSGLTLNIILPMYSGNATSDVPQRIQLKAKVNDVRSDTLSLKRLEDARKRVAIAKGDAHTAPPATELKQFLHVPSVELNYHSKKHGEEKGLEKDRTYFQLDIEKIASSFSHTHISKLLFLAGTWTATECHPSSANIDCPAHPGSKLGHLHLSVLNSSVSYSGNDCYSLTSAVVGEVSVAIVREAAAKRLGSLLPVVYGPIDTYQWNSASFYQCSLAEGLPQQQSHAAAEKRLVEFYVARPYQNVKDLMFPTFQLSISGCGVCLDPALLQFIKQLPLEAYYGASSASTDGGHTHEAMQLQELEAPPTITAPSVVADEAQDASSKYDLLSIAKGYATKVKIHPIIIVFPEKECTSLLSDSAVVDILPEFPILPLLSSGPSRLGSSAVVLALPDVLLESARSHVLDEPVPRETQVDTLPWDCSLADICVFTIIERKTRYLLEPLVVKATLAPQQEGSGITIHLESLTLAVSKKQVKLVNSVSHDLVSMVTRLLISSSTSPNGPASLEVDDSGIIVSSKQGEPSISPSPILSSPAHSTVTPPTFPVGSEVSTVSSSLVFQGFSTLWVQLLVSKLVLNIYNQQKTTSAVHSNGSSEYSTPFTSPPSAADKETVSSKQLGGSLSSSNASSVGSEAVSISFEVDGISLQVDIQERCTDMIFKMASMECSYLKKHFRSDDPSTTKVSWLPYLSNSKGKLFSSSSSSLPEELSRITDPLSHPLDHVPFDQAPAHTRSSPQHPFSPKLQPNFVQLKVKLPHLQLHHTTKLSLSVKPFEVVAWLPVLDTITEVFSAAGPVSSNGSECKDTKTCSAKSTGGGVVTWPSVELNVECFRVVLPNIDHSHFLLLGVGGVSVTSSLDYAGPDIRYITNSSVFRRLSLLSSERKQPALPAYQVDAISLSLWGVDNSNTSVSVALFGVCSSLRVVYTPPLRWAPHITPPHPGSAHLLAPPTVTGPPKSKSSVLATGHCVEVNLTSDVVMLCGTQQVLCLSEVIRNNCIAERGLSADDGRPTSPASERGTPAKFLLVGRSISFSLLAAMLTNETTPTGLATPLMLATIYNPVCVVELSSNVTKMEASCFNTDINFSLEQASLSYIDLAAEPLSNLTSVMKQQLLETRKGQSHDKTGLPPSLLSVSWLRQSEDLESGSKARVISLEVGRPVKLSLSLSFLQEALKTLVQLKEIVKMQLPVGHQNGVGGNRNEISVDEKSSSELFATPQTSMNLSSCEHGDLESDLKPTEVIVTTNQVVMELVIATSDITDIENDSLTSSTAAQEVDVLLQGEPVPLSSKCVSKEGLLLAWQSFTLAVPPGGTLTNTSELSIDSLQLLSIMEGVSGDIVPPLHINCLITQHKPCSIYDLPHSSIKLSCDLLLINLSRANMELVKRAVDRVTDLLQKSSNEIAQMESCDPEPIARSDSCTREVNFTDDLRTGEFTYIMNESNIPQVPLPGNIVFHHGNCDAPPTMTWQYGEPRAITKLYILPVPFTITTEEDAPVDIKLSCSLEYWSDVNSCYQSVAHFHVSESTPVEWELPLAVSHGSVASRRWRISVNHLEWVDEDLEEIISESVTSVSGTLIPLSSILSPVSLAACTRVDSLSSPLFVPLLSLSVHCQHLQLSFLHHLYQLPSVTTETGSTAACMCYQDYKVVSSHQSQEAIELFRITLDEARLFLRQRKESNTLLKVGARLKGEYVDRGSLVWRSAFCPSEVALLLEYESKYKGMTLTDDSCSGLSVSLKCAPTALRLSQSLVHTTSMAVSLWSGQTTAAASLTAHYVLCNDTLDDIHFGQVATGEDLLLPSNSCIGYSWRNHKASLQLHVCVVCDGSWRWTKPFSVGQDGLQAIDIPIGRYMATLLVKIQLIGGLQKQVTFLGSWKFISSLHFPLELQLTLASQSPDAQPHSHKGYIKQHSSSSTAAPQQLKVLTLQPQQSLPSIVAADSLVGGVRFRMANGGPGGWSKIYPLGSSVHHGQWSKPHLLAELSTEDGGPLHFWYNTAPLETSSKKVWGNKISFSPLFVITNHLPYELTVTITDSQLLPTLPTSTPSSYSSSMSTQKEWLLSGGGTTKPLYSLSADSWYHLQFNISCTSLVERSDPSLALSTFLLHHLPVSKDDQSLEQKTPDNPSTKPAIAYLSLPLGDGSSCTIHAALVRNSLNTITAVLRTELMVVNMCPWEMAVVELGASESEEKEALWEGKVLVGERREKTTVLGPLEKAVCVQKQFMLAVRLEDIRLTSKPLHFPTLPLSQQKSKGADSNTTTTAVQLTLDSTFEGEPQKVIGEVSLTYLKEGTTITAVLKPSYVIHNTTDSCVHAWPSVVSKYDSPTMNVDPNPALVKDIQPGGTQPIFLWQKLTESSGKALTPAFRLATAPSLGSLPSSWSILLSPRFVRHSFSLPANDPSQSNLPTLLTMHELENTTFLVIARDPSPRLLVQNLCPTVLEVIETDAKGIHSSPQLLLPGHEVVYDPPSIAKLYPVVYDSEIASEEETRLHSKAQKVSLCFRVKSSPTQGFGKGWSHAYPLANEQDIILGIPEHGDVLVSMDRCGHSQFISILPTGEVQPMQRTTHSFAASLTKPSKREMKFSCSLERFVLCLDDDTASQNMISQVLQLVTDEVEILYWRSKTKGTKIELSLRSLQVNNMTVQSSAEFSVVLLPRSEHAARPQLIRNEPPPLIRALVQYNPRMDNVVDLVHVMTQPVTVQLEDSLLHRLRTMLPSFSMPGVLRTPATPTKNTLSLVSSSDLYAIPAAVLREAEIDTAPLIISRLVIGPSAVYLTASITLKAFLSCRDSPFRFSEYELIDISSNLSEVSQVVAARYISAIFMHLGWLLGSLELIGSPGTFIQNIGSGLRDLISLPYEGLTRSPGLFILGIGHGAVSFIRNFSTGALTSITNFASSVARNMERLSMDTDLALYQDQKRKEQPTTHFTSGVSTGVSSFGLSLISAVAGIIDQPMQSFQRIDESSSALSATRSVLAGVGKGLIGVVTKPVGGAMELVSHTGQGIMHGTGLIPKLRHRSIGQELEVFTQALMKSEFNPTATACQRKLEYGPCVATVHAARATLNGSEQNMLLLLTLDKIYLLDCHSNTLQQHFSIEHTRLERQEAPHSSGLVEIHFIPHSKSAINKTDALSPTNFQSVEYYLTLSQLEAQAEMPIAASSSIDEDEDNHRAIATQSDAEKCDTSSNIILLVGEQEATQFLSVYQSIRSHSLEPELNFCVYSSLVTTREESFISACSQPTI